jgi:hypothetical protein
MLRRRRLTSLPTRPRPRIHLIHNTHAITSSVGLRTP